MRFLHALMVLLLLLGPAAAGQEWEQEWEVVSSVPEIDALAKDVVVVEVRFDRGEDDDRLLAALAERQLKLRRLILRSFGGADVRPIEPLARFTELTHLEIYEGVSNFCRTDPATGARELDVVAGLTSLRSLILDIY